MNCATKVLIILFLVLNLSIFGFASNNNHFFKNQSQQKEIVATLVSQNKIDEEPLLINGVVVKKSKDKSVCLIRIVSETYKGRLLVIKGYIDVNEGKKIEGYLYKDKFALFTKGG